MQIIKRENVQPQDLPGRRIWRIAGKDSFFESSRISYGFTFYSNEVGQMEPHQHAEEVCFVVYSKGGWARFGQQADALQEKVPLETGMILHIPAHEWHMFSYDEGGSLEIMFMYGQVDNVRPEDER